MVILMSGVKIKLEVENHDEIYYPVVSVVNRNMAQMPQMIDVVKSPRVAEVTENNSLQDYNTADNEREPAEHRERCEKAFTRRCKRKAAFFPFCRACVVCETRVFHIISPFVSFFAL